MDIQSMAATAIVAGLIILALYFRPLRKTIGLLLVILGGLISLTVVGLIVGIPAIIVGGLLLFF